MKQDNIVESLDKILKKTQPKTVLDLGCNTGRFSILASQHQAKVVSVDSSEDCLEHLYRYAKQNKCHIHPVFSDLVSPTPPFGFLGKQFPSYAERFRSEMVFCLGLMHHLHISGRQPFSNIAKLLDAVSSKYVVFEYVDVEDDNSALVQSNREIRYSLEDVRRALEKYFKITMFDSDRDTRSILLCEK